MTRAFTRTFLALGLTLAVGSFAFAQSAPKPAPVDAARAQQIASEVLYTGQACSVLRAVDGMNEADTLAAVKAIENAGQTLVRGSMGSIVSHGDPGQTDVTLMYMTTALFHVMFSNAHPTVDQANSWCFDQGARSKKLPLNP